MSGIEFITLVFFLLLRVWYLYQLLFGDIIDTNKLGKPEKKKKGSKKW